MKMTEKQLRQIIKEELARAKKQQRLTEATVEQVVQDQKVSTVMTALAQQLCAKLGLSQDPGAMEGMLDGVKGAVADLIKDRTDQQQQGAQGKQKQLQQQQQGQQLKSN